MTAEGADPTRLRVLSLLQRHGRNTTSFQALEPGFAYWFADDEACVAYVDTGRAWVAAGAPICAVERFAAVAQGFVAAARARDRRASWFATEELFVATTPLVALQLGEQPVWDPSRWDECLRASRGLREQLRRARAKGVRIRALGGEELATGHPTRVAIDGLIARWLATRPMPPMGFLVALHPFTFPEVRRGFVAEVEGQVVGFLGVIPIFAREGWFLEDLLRDPVAPNGTAELLVDAAMRSAAAEGRRRVTLGLAPLAGEVGPVLRAARRLGAGLYDFDGLRAFKAKLRPHAWEPVYLSCPPEQNTYVAIVDGLAAFARNGLLRFGVQTLLRGPAVVVRLLAVLLIPWTIVLALPVSDRFFPSAAVQWGWVAFDAVAVVALLALAQRWRPGLAAALAVAVTLDAVLTLIQVITWNAPRVRGALDVAVLVVAVAAPSFAALLLHGARAHRAAPGRADARVALAASGPQYQAKRRPT